MKKSLSLIMSVALLGCVSTTYTPDKPFVNTLGMKFVTVPGTEVQFSIWETRMRDYAAYAAANSSVDDYWKSPFSTTETSPVSRISWEDANAFCEWLTQKERVEGKITVNQRYRLPKDAEWSVAVGLGQELGNTPEEKHNSVKGVYPWGNAWPPPKGSGNRHGSLEVDSYAYTSPVGSFAPNKFGLHDLGGNMWEWCEDSYSPLDLQHRVLRAAFSALTSRRASRTATFLCTRSSIFPGFSRIRRIRGLRGHTFGFRCVLASD